MVLPSPSLPALIFAILVCPVPPYGTGNVPVQTILEKLGFDNVYVVPEQELPNGNFPTVDYPNPEDVKTFDMALKLADKVGADVVLANDPDADRLGVLAKDSKTGEYKIFTGNMSGLLIAEYILSQRKARRQLPKNGALVTTIVSPQADGIIQEVNKVKEFSLIRNMTKDEALKQKLYMEVGKALDNLYYKARPCK